MRLRGLRAAGWCLAAALAAGLPSTATAVESVRIAVAIGVDRVIVSGPGLSVTPLREAAVPWKPPSARAEVRLAGEVLTVDGQPVDAAGVAFTAEGPLRASGAPMPLAGGEVEVRRDGQALSVVHALPLEAYVAAVIGSEMPAWFPREALRAQAVAARTFAVFKKLEAVAAGRSWHMGATVLDQVYGGARVDPRARAAALDTAGEVLTFDHAPIEAYFHSTCGGRTERGAEALGRDLPYLVSVPCDRCHASPRFDWTVRVPAAELGRRCGLPGPATSVKVTARTSSGRAARVALRAGLREVTLSAVELRQRLGYARLPSLLFEARLSGGEVVFHGHGAGHGAGLCQWGAAGAARAGEDHRAILTRYYPGTEIVRMY